MSQKLDDLYKEVVLDHFRRPRHKGTLDSPPARRARGYNPLCGDEVEVYVTVDDGRISDIMIDGRGCAISQSSASMMSELAAGKTVEEFEAAFGCFRSMLNLGREDDQVYKDNEPPGAQLGDAEALRSVREFPTRVKCATLGWNTLEQAIKGAGDFTETRGRQQDEVNGW